MFNVDIEFAIERYATRKKRAAQHARELKRRHARTERLMKAVHAAERKFGDIENIPENSPELRAIRDCVPERWAH